jgi:hypothetical protein
MAEARRKLYAILAEDDAGEPEDEPEDEVPEG